MEKMEVNKQMSNFWKSKKVFITGHNGFKGSWLTRILHLNGAKIKGFSLSPNESSLAYYKLNISQISNDFSGDIRNNKQLKSEILKFSPEIIFHLAAQPIVKDSYTDPITTYETNVLGTLNVLKSSYECNSVKLIIVVTSDKCYENKEWEFSYRENDRLGGYDPYSSSKACCEILTESFKKSFKTSNSPRVATVRAGNVIGGGDWSSYRLIPDIFKALEKNNKISIRFPQAIRPWQHVLEPLSGYIKLAEKLYYSSEYEGAWNFGPIEQNCKTVIELVEIVNKKLNNCIDLNIDELNKVHEATFLKLDCSKANSKINWYPKWNLEDSLSKTVEWYISKNNNNILKISDKHIYDYFKE